MEMMETWWSSTNFVEQMVPLFVLNDHVAIIVKCCHGQFLSFILPGSPKNPNTHPEQISWSMEQKSGEPW